MYGKYFWWRITLKHDNREQNRVWNRVQPLHKYGKYRLKPVIYFFLKNLYEQGNYFRDYF